MANLVQNGKNGFLVVTMATGRIVITDNPLQSTQKKFPESLEYVLIEDHWKNTCFYNK